LQKHVEELVFLVEQRVHVIQATNHLKDYIMKNETEWQTQIAEQNAADALANARGTLIHALHELDSYIEKFDAADSPTRKAELLNWTLNHLATGITPNLRLDLIANAQAMFTRLAK
jgi:hypothetical protein